MISTTSAELAVASPVAESVLVTTDSQGRVRISKEQRRAVLAQFERSGLSAVKFAKVAGLKYSTLAGWLQRYRRSKPKGRPGRMRLLEAVIDPGGSAALTAPKGVVLHLPSQVRLELCSLADVPIAAALVQALQSAVPRC
jgi:transposase-like protein